jgi:hypothetical protein
MRDLYEYDITQEDCAPHQAQEADRHQLAEEVAGFGQRAVLAQLLQLDHAR